MLEKIRAFQAQVITIVAVSHSPDLMKSFCEWVSWLDHGRQVTEVSAGEVADRYLESMSHTAIGV